MKSSPNQVVTEITNAASDRILTVGTVSDEQQDLNGEANLTFDGSTLTVAGNLTVTGTTTSVSTTNTVVKDKLIELGNGSTGSASGDAGIVIERGSDTNVFIGWDESEDKITVGTGSFTGASTGDLSLTDAALKTGAITASGVVTATGFTIGNAVIAESELEQIDGITAGTVTSSKAVVVDANKDVGTIRNLTIDGTFSDGNYTFDTSGNVTGLGTVACGAITSSGVLDITDATDASDATGDTGALRTEGGASIAKKLYVGTDLDVDGTSNLDAVDIDGAVQVDGTITVGANDQGYDVIFYGDTASANMTWDTSADDLILNGAARVLIPEGQLVLGSTAVSSSAAELNILDGKSFVDEDDMNSNSATAIASQQSIKAYVDAQVTAQDLDATTDSGTIAIDLDSETLTVAGGEGIDTSATGNTITIACEDSTANNKGAVIVAGGTGATVSYSSGTATIAVDAAQTQITSVGTIAAGTWQGTAIASAYLDSDTAHLSGSQTFTGAKTFTGGVTIDEGELTLGSTAIGATAAEINAACDASARSAAAVDVTADHFLFCDGSATGATKVESIADLVAGVAGSQATTGLTASSGTLVVTDLHPVGVSGSANQLLTDDGDGTVTSEAKLLCDGATVTIGNGTAEDTYLKFDGNAEDFRIGIDDGTDTLEIGVGAAHGTTPVIKVDAATNCQVMHNSAVADGEYSGNLAMFQAGEDLTAGEVVYLKSDGKVWKAVATAAATSRCVAMSVATTSANAMGPFLLEGFARFNSEFPQWTVGGVLYTPEAETSSKNVPEQTAPDTDGDFVQVLGYAISADAVYFKPSDTVIEVA